MQPAASTGRPSSLPKDSHTHNVQPQKTSSEPRTLGAALAEPNQTGVQEGINPEEKEAGAQLPPQRMDSIDSHAGSYYSHSSHSSHSTTSSSSFHLPRTDSLATTLSYPDSEDDAAPGQHIYSLAIRTKPKTSDHYHPPRSYSARNDPLPNRASLPRYPTMRDGYIRQAHNTFPVAIHPVVGQINTPQPSESGPLRRGTMPERTVVKLEESPQIVPTPEDTPLCTNSVDDTKAACEIQVKSERHDDSGQSQLAVEPAIPESPSSTSGEHVPSRKWPRYKLTEDVCDTLLKDAFGIELQDLPVHNVVRAWNSVNLCLEEVSKLLSANKSTGFSLPIRQAAGDQPSGSNAGSDLSQRSAAGADDGLGKGKKRQRPLSHFRSNDGDDNDQSEGEQSSGDGEPGRKKSKVVRYSCPYRKRNPRRFNIRDHTSCATAWFDDVPHVKRHVKKFHRRESTPYVCILCRTDLEGKGALEAHLKRATLGVCEVVPKKSNDDPEAGITLKVEDSLNERKSKTKIDTWTALWGELFPCDNEIPCPQFVAPVELCEVQAEFENTTADLRNRVASEMHSIPDFNSAVRPHITAQLEAAVNDYIQLVLENSQLHATTCVTRKRHRNNHTANTNTTTCPPQPTLLAPPAPPRQIAPKTTRWVSDGCGSSLSSSVETTTASAVSWGVDGPLPPTPPPVVEAAAAAGGERPKTPFRDSGIIMGVSGDSYCDGGGEGPGVCPSMESVTGSYLDTFDETAYGPLDAFPFAVDPFGTEQV